MTYSIPPLTQRDDTDPQADGPCPRPAPARASDLGPELGHRSPILRYAGTRTGRKACRSTCGVERFQQTLKNWLAAQPHQPTTIAALQALLDAFASTYNQQRPHRSLPHRATPATAYTTRPKANPSCDTRTGDSHDRVRTAKIDKTGCVTLRVAGKLRHIGVGRPHAGTHVTLLIHDLHLRVINAATRELLRELQVDPTRDYQPRGRGTPK
jgi:Integrase core domain